jgi:hypothetical protein
MLLDFIWLSETRKLFNSGKASLLEVGEELLNIITWMNLVP